jgi:hypothetical protein
MEKGGRRVARQYVTARTFESFSSSDFRKCGEAPADASHRTTANTNPEEARLSRSAEFRASLLGDFVSAGNLASDRRSFCNHHLS